MPIPQGSRLSRNIQQPLAQTLLHGRHHRITDMHMAPFPAVGSAVPVLRDTSAEANSGYISALAGDRVRILHIGTGECDKGWAYTHKLNHPTEEGWIHVSLLIDRATHVQDSSSGADMASRMGRTEDSANAFQHMHIIIKIGTQGFERKGICTENAAVRWAHALHLIYTESSVDTELLFTGRICKQAVSAAIILNAPMDQEVGSLDFPALAAFLTFYGLKPEERARLSYLDLCFTLADPWTG